MAQSRTLWVKSVTKALRILFESLDELTRPNDNYEPTRPNDNYEPTPPNDNYYAQEMRCNAFPVAAFPSTGVEGSPAGLYL